MVMGGAKGHLAVLEWSTKHLVTELQVRLYCRPSGYISSTACSARVLLAPFTGCCFSLACGRPGSRVPEE